MRAAILWRTDFQSDDKSSIETAHSQVKDLVKVIAPTREQMNAMRMTVAGLPRITSAFNTAKKHTIEVLMAFDRELEAAQNLAIEAERELRENPRRITTASCLCESTEGAAGPLSRDK